MDEVTVFLRTALFSLGGDDAHVPPGAVVLIGTIVDRPAGALTLDVRKTLDGRGRPLGEKAVRIQVPWSKIDNILLENPS